VKHFEGDNNKIMRKNICMNLLLRCVFAGASFGKKANKTCWLLLFGNGGKTLLPFGQHLPKTIKTSAFFGGIGTRGDETPFQPSRVSVPKGIDRSSKHFEREDIVVHVEFHTPVSFQEHFTKHSGASRSEEDYSWNVYVHVHRWNSKRGDRAKQWSQIVANNVARLWDKLHSNSNNVVNKYSGEGQVLSVKVVAVEVKIAKK
jgi:hypothetical protein